MSMDQKGPTIVQTTPHVSDSQLTPITPPPKGGGGEAKHHPPLALSPGGDNRGKKAGAAAARSNSNRHLRPRRGTTHAMQARRKSPRRARGCRTDCANEGRRGGGERSWCCVGDFPGGCAGRGQAGKGKMHHSVFMGERREGGGGASSLSAECSAVLFFGRPRGKGGPPVSTMA